MNALIKHEKFQKTTTLSVYTLYFIVNLLTLIQFPLVHSDEVWLGKLSSAYLSNRSFYTTEPFFDLFPRQAHTIKSLFHLCQSAFILLFGEKLFSLRLLSLLAGFAILLLLHSLFQKKLKHHWLSLLVVMTLGLNVQFIYASHFGRQEILLFLVLTLCLFFYSRDHSTANYRVILPALLIGISIGFHPNAFIVSAMFFALLLVDYFNKKIKLIHLITYIAILAGCASFYIVTSLIGNPNFIQDYYTYGSTLSVDADAAGRLKNFIDFYIKLYVQISGTYYLPDIRFTILLPFILFIPLIIITLISRKNIVSKTIQSKFYRWYLVLLAYNTALFIIGRFNPTSIIFHLIPLIMILGEISHWLYKKSPKSTLTLCLLLSAIVLYNGSITYDAYETYKYHTFTDYNAQLMEAINEESVILGNLSGGFTFSNNTFYDIRNLSYLDEMSLEDYLLTNKINTIIYHEEYDYIHRNPQWQILYGDDTLYYDDLNDIIKTHGSLVHEFNDAYYGSRIIRYIGDYPWSIQIYTIDLEDE